jgi:cytoskeleton protein RodZ
VDTGIGPTLREARNRRKVDLSEVETAIKIRVRYLQAIENEEWDALPGPAYTRGFIRTYAIYLGLDGERLADEFSRTNGPAEGERVPKRVEPVQSGARRGPLRVSGPVLIGTVCLVLIAVVVGIGLAGGGGGSSSSNAPPADREGQGQSRKSRHKKERAAKPGVEMRLAATAEVWVCVLAAGEKPLVDGQILEEGAELGPFHSGGYELALGNGSVKMFVDGKQAEIPESSSPVGYSIDGKGELIALEEGERPSCE